MVHNSLQLPIQQSANIRLLVENTARGANILGEHGLSWWIDLAGHRVLFDLGQGMTLRSNAELLGVDWTSADAVVFSHGHYDHVGGWHGCADGLTKSRVYAHPAALELKYQKRTDGRMVPAGDPDFASALRASGCSLQLSAAPVEVIPGLWTTGEVPRSNDFEDSGGDFYAGPGGERPDPLLDDLSLFFLSEAGLVVILGCAHAGLINILRHCIALTGERVHAVIGGLHLLHASEDRMVKTIDALDAIGVNWLAPNHCTGDAALAAIRTAFPGRVLEMHAGQSLRFPLNQALS